MNGKDRSERWRERRRKGKISVTIDVSLAHRLAFERMGLVAAGNDRDRQALIWAVERYLDTARAVQQIGDALYPETDASPVRTGNDDEATEDEMWLPDNNAKTGTNA